MKMVLTDADYDEFVICLSLNSIKSPKLKFTSVIVRRLLDKEQPLVIF